jgi:hypothetical protein
MTVELSESVWGTFRYLMYQTGEVTRREVHGSLRAFWQGWDGYFKLRILLPSEVSRGLGTARSQRGDLTIHEQIYESKL